MARVGLDVTGVVVKPFNMTQEESVKKVSERIVKARHRGFVTHAAHKLGAAETKNLFNKYKNIEQKVDKRREYLKQQISGAAKG